MRTIRRPSRFGSWREYEDAYGVDMLLDVNVMRCRRCGEQWAIRHNRGKLLQRAHVCPNECNGKLSRRRGGQPPMLRQRLEGLQDWRGVREADERWEEHEVRADWFDEEAREMRRAEGRARRARTQTWMQLRREPEKWAALDRLWDEAAMQPDPLAYVAEECTRLRRVDRA